MENLPPNRNPQKNRMASSIRMKYFSQNFYLFRTKQFWTVRTNFWGAKLIHTLHVLFTVLRYFTSGSFGRTNIAKSAKN
jgi:hypothetical protein